MTTPMILNPAAGGGRAAKLAPRAIEALRRGGIEVEVFATSGPGHATQLAQSLAGDHDHILCAGGDGTTYEVINGLFPTEHRPRLGTIPLGTGNSFLKDFGIRTADDALVRIVGGDHRAVDVVRIEHTGGVLHFLNLLSIGFTAEVGKTTNRWFKPLGPAGYAVATVLEVARMRHQIFPITADDAATDARPCVFLSFNNSRCTGGDMQMAPDADPADGQLDVVRIGPLSKLDLLATFPKIYQGTHLQHPKNSASRARRVELDLPGPTPVMVDGEVVDLHLTALEVLPGALELDA